MDYSDEAAREAQCWFDADRAPRDAETTAWKRRARFRQARWRIEHGHSIGAEPYQGGADSTPVGSRLDLAFAKQSGANFLTAAALDAARSRVATPERHQTLRAARLWADLLSSMPLCFNLFGDLAADPLAAAKAVEAWWPSAPRGGITVRFEHSPARADRAFLGNKSAFDVAIEVAAGLGERAIIGIETKYHEHTKPGASPRPAALARYTEVTERSGIFANNWAEHIVGKELQQVWLDHLLVLAMLQHPSKQWSWGRFVLVYPSDNPSFARAASRYRDLLLDDSTFEARTIESLLATAGALSTQTVNALRRRYL